MQYMLLIYNEPGVWGTMTPERAAVGPWPSTAPYTEELQNTGKLVAGDALQPITDRDVGPRPRRRDADDRRAVRRDEGSARRLLPDRRRDARRGARVGRQDPRRTVRHDRGASAWSPTTRRCVVDELSRAYRDERARSIAILGRVLGDLDLAEDAVQDAFVRAAERWPRDGVPRNPGAWIVATARNRAIDRIRREQTLARKTELLARAEELPDDEETTIPDERLELIFACCHPGARPGGAGRADAEPRRRADDAGDRARLPRPRADAGAAARAREAEDPRRRHPAARAARAPPAGAAAHRPRDDLPRLQRRLRAAGAARAVRRGDPARGGARDADARRGGGARPARAAAPAGRAARRACLTRDGELVLLADQDRALWDTARDRPGTPRARPRARAATAGPVPAPGRDRLASLRRRRRTGRRSRCSTAGLRSSLPRRSWSSTAPSPWRWPRVRRPGSSCSTRIAGLDDYYLYHSARADLLRRLGQPSATEYERAFALAPSDVERAFLRRRQDLLAPEP